MGLIVLGETGKKTSKSNLDYLINDVEKTLAAGAEKVFFEAKEFVDADGDINYDLIEKLGEKVNVDSLIFETPGTWIKGVHFFTQYRLWKILINSFGANVNIANIPNLDALNRLSLMRLGLGADTGLGNLNFTPAQNGMMQWKNSLFLKPNHSLLRVPEKY